MPQPHQIIREARLLERLNRAACVEVWRAARLKSEAPVIVRALSGASDAAARARFIEEGRALAELRLEGLTQIEALDVDEAAWLLTPVEGRLLSARVAEGGVMGVDELLTWLRPAAAALARLHAEGRCHGRLRPSHLLRSAMGDICLLGLGLTPEDPDDLEAARFTPCREQGEAGACAEADVYSLAAVAYFALTGHPPFDGPTPHSVRRAAAREPLSARLQPEGLMAILRRALAADPAARFKHPQAFLSALEPFTAARLIDGHVKEINALLAGARARRGAQRPASAAGRALSLLALLALIIGAGALFSRLPSVKPTRLSPIPPLPTMPPRLDLAERILTQAPQLQRRMEAIQAQVALLHDLKARHPLTEPLRVRVDPQQEAARRRLGEARAAALGIEWRPLKAGRITYTPEGEGAAPVAVFIDALEMSAGEITVGKYAACVALEACAVPFPLEPLCLWGEAAAARPINCLTFQQARDFAAWAGARLPTELEWIYAAHSQGLDLPYPWGEAPPTCEHAHLAGCGARAPQPSCQHLMGHSAQGICDLIGGVEEWAEAAPMSLGGASPSHMEIAAVVCGGSFMDTPPLARGACSAQLHAPLSPARGLRLARDPR
ncbi:SUMF1/EgtB/PvdO family nonheme iron enzyme [Myxococcota bacterium]|nr:SUMF1/EgtB/PvdO family nonheme iron enzyme [Myxococcota bacterium]